MPFCGEAAQPYWKKMTSIQNGDVIEVFALLTGILGRAQTGKCAKFIDEMSLVIVATRHRQVAPIKSSWLADKIHRRLEAANAAMEFGCQADLIAKKLDESSCAQPAQLGDFGNRRFQGNT